MNKIVLIIYCSIIAFFASCADYNRVVKTQDYEYKYEVAKQYYAEGMYNRAALLIQDILSVLKGTDQGEESLYLSGLCNMKAHSYDAAATIFRKYYQTYPKGKYVEEARFNCGKSLYMITPEPKLDQTETFQAVTEFQNFIENFPSSKLRPQAQELIFKLQDKLVEKEYLSAKLYYDLGSYIGNGSNGNGSNGSSEQAREHSSRSRRSRRPRENRSAERQSRPHNARRPRAPREKQESGQPKEQARQDAKS